VFAVDESLYRLGKRLCKPTFGSPSWNRGELDFRAPHSVSRLVIAANVRLRSYSVPMESAALM
jgi:hypothetical protein